MIGGTSFRVGRLISKFNVKVTINAYEAIEGCEAIDGCQAENSIKAENQYISTCKEYCNWSKRALVHRLFSYRF